MKSPFAALGLTSLIALPAAVHATVTITPASGYTITWDGNDGVGFNPASPAPAPASLANAPGAVAFTSSDLGPLLSIPFHVAANLNDGLYGNDKVKVGLRNGLDAIDTLFHKGGRGGFTGSAGCQTLEAPVFERFWAATGSQKHFYYIIIKVR